MTLTPSDIRCTSPNLPRAQNQYKQKLLTAQLTASQTTGPKSCQNAKNLNVSSAALYGLLTCPLLATTDATCSQPPTTPVHHLQNAQHATGNKPNCKRKIQFSFFIGYKKPNMKIVKLLAFFKKKETDSTNKRTKFTSEVIFVFYSAL